MHKITIAFCEEEEEYQQRFVTYLMEHKAEEIAVHVFSDVKHFVEGAMEKHFDLILIGSGFFSLAQALWERRFPVLYLAEECTQVAEAENYQNGEGKMPCVFRYQSMETILHEIIALSQKNVPPGRNEYRLSHMQVIGVYSPCGHEMQMPFSMVLAGQQAAAGRKVLYMNLISCSGFIELFDLEGERDLGDLLIRLRKNRLKPETFCQCVYQSEGISYIAPFYNPANLREMTMEDLTALITYIEQNTDFEIVLLDFGDGLAQFTEMLKLCSVVYCPERQGFYYECRKNHFMKYLEETTGGYFRQKLCFVNLPYSAKGIRGGMDVWRQLNYSDFGDYVRNYLEGGKEWTSPRQ